MSGLILTFTSIRQPGSGLSYHWFTLVDLGQGVLRLRTPFTVSLSFNNHNYVLSSFLLLLITTGKPRDLTGKMEREFFRPKKEKKTKKNIGVKERFI